MINSVSTKVPFKGFLYNTSCRIENNALLNRSLVDLFGATVPWIIMANNKDERRERAVRLSVGFFLAYLTPFVTLPLSNRLAMKSLAKLTDKYWSKSAKFIQLSNENLLSAEKTKEGIEILAQKLNIKPDEILKHCKNDYEVLRQKLITNKNVVFSSDFLFTGISMGSASWISNAITKMTTGRKGFSAEFEMADKSTVEKRAEKYEKTKVKKYATVVGACLLTGVTLPVLLAMALKKPQNTSKTFDFLRKHASKFDYKDGIFMSRLAMLLMCGVGSQLGTILAARNKTELKDILIRYGSGDALFFGGDLVLANLFAKLLSGVKGIDLKDKTEDNKKLVNKVFAPLRKMEKIEEMVKEGKIDPKNMKAAFGIYWVNFLLIVAALGFALPKILNKVIKQDVEKDKASLNVSHNAEFIKNFFAKNKVLKAGG